MSASHCGHSSGGSFCSWRFGVVALDRLLDAAELAGVEPDAVTGGAAVDLDVRLVGDGVEGSLVSRASHGW
jgi:hypothetical protein